MQFNEYSINLLQGKFQHKEVIETLLDHALDNGYVTKVLKLCQRDGNVGHNQCVRNKIGLSTVAKGIVTII